MWVSGAVGAAISLRVTAGWAQDAPISPPVSPATGAGAGSIMAAAADGTALPKTAPVVSSPHAPQTALSGVQVEGQAPSSPSASTVVVAADGSQAPASDGQWVYLNGRGWTWLPGDVGAVATNDEPYVYVYTPSIGWNWVVSPWGWGPYYYGPWAVAYGPGFWGGYYHSGPGAWGGWHGGAGWGGGYRGGAPRGGGNRGTAPAAPGGWGGNANGGSRPAARGYQVAHPQISSHSSMRGGSHFGTFGGGGGHFGGHGGGGHGGGRR
jgi:hypothetical protein